jgi:DNA-binding beta-propeller fold protein YncE
VARFGLVQGITLDAAGNLYVADGSNDTIRKLTPSGTDWMVTTLAGSPGQAGAVDGVGSDARFNQPTGVAVDSAGTVYVVDSAEQRISRGALAPATAVVRFDTTTLILTSGFFLPRVITSTSGTLILEVSTNFQSWIPIQTNAAPAGTVPFSVPVGLAPYEFFRAHLVP